MWVKGDLHIHSNACFDASLPVAEIIKRSKNMIDFLAIAGHALGNDEEGEKQYRQILEARKQYPNLPIFHTGEVEFPVERHCMFICAPDDREFQLRSELVKNFDRTQGHVGIEEAKACLKYVEENWGDKAFMVFNHPDSPPVLYSDLLELAKSSVFKIMACYDRQHRIAPQCWEPGAEWDKLLCAGYKIFTRFGSDFHVHFDDGGSDYYPGEFVQDQMEVGSNSYDEIFSAYRNGKFFCTTDNLISELRLEFINGKLMISFKCNLPVDYFEIISDSNIIKTVSGIPVEFKQDIQVEPGGYYRLRGFGFERKCRYSGKIYRPVFMSNPIFMDDY